MKPVTGVPTHTSAPISPNTAVLTGDSVASAPSTSTSTSIQGQQNDHAPNVSQTTSSSSSTSSAYLPARPGASAFPAPTSAARVHPSTNYTPNIPHSAPSTITPNSNNPYYTSPYPPPPPPPKVGEPVQPASYYAPRTHPAQAQEVWPSPGYGSTSTVTFPPSRSVDEGEGGGDEQGFLDTAKSWMQFAGTKLAEAEAEIWRLVNSGS
jgi:hypothetical protein